MISALRRPPGNNFLALHNVTRLLIDIAAQSEVVGMSFAEHIPRDALNLKTMLDKLPFLQ